MKKDLKKLILCVIACISFLAFAACTNPGCWAEGNSDGSSQTGSSQTGGSSDNSSGISAGANELPLRPIE